MIINYCMRIPFSLLGVSIVTLLFNGFALADVKSLDKNVISSFFTELNQTYSKAGGGYSFSYLFHEDSGTIEICPDNLCNYYRFPATADLDEVFEFIYLQMYWNSGFTEIDEYWKKSSKIQLKIKSITKIVSDKYQCSNNSSNAFCVLEKLSTANEIEFGFVRYDEGERIEEESKLDSIKQHIIKGK